jgi:hypothetical protein
LTRTGQLDACAAGSWRRKLPGAAIARVHGGGETARSLRFPEERSAPLYIWPRGLAPFARERSKDAARLVTPRNRIAITVDGGAVLEVDSRHAVGAPVGGDVEPKAFSALVLLTAWPPEKLRPR